MLSDFMALDIFPGIEKKNKNGIILGMHFSVKGLNYCLLIFALLYNMISEMVQRWKKVKTEQEEEWTFQKSLLDSRNRRAFSVRGRARNFK